MLYVQRFKHDNKKKAQNKECDFQWGPDIQVGILNKSNFWRCSERK